MSLLFELWGLSGDTMPPSELVEATDLLVAHIKPDRLVATVNRPAQALGGRSLREIAATGDAAEVLSLVRRMFAVDDVTG